MPRTEWRKGTALKETIGVYGVYGGADDVSVKSARSINGDEQASPVQDTDRCSLPKYRVCNRSFNIDQALRSCSPVMLHPGQDHETARNNAGNNARNNTERIFTYET